MADDPRLPSARNNLGLVLAHRGRFAEAIGLFDAALRLDPGYVQAARNRALVLRLAGKQKL
jgi:lipoprotein NlpI